MKQRIKRILEIIGGVGLLLVGFVLVFTPGPAFVAFIAGIFLISPQHGRRVVWYAKKYWKRVKMWWYSWKFKRVVRRKIFLKAKRLKSKILRKK